MLLTCYITCITITQPWNIQRRLQYLQNINFFYTKIYTSWRQATPYRRLGFVGDALSITLRRGGVRPASRDHADHTSGTHYNTSLTLRETAQPNIAHQLLNTLHVRHVTVCSALHRTTNTGTYSSHDYNDRVGRYNNILRHYCDTERDITYHTHRGFWQCPLHVWSHDGTHPNTTHGRKLYIKSLRRATHYSVKHVARV